jgi:hypothetical protein
LRDGPPWSPGAWWPFLPPWQHQVRQGRDICFSSSVTMLTDIWWSVGYTDENLLCVSNSYRNYWLHRAST